jgi:hypothetical protein
MSFATGPFNWQLAKQLHKRLAAATTPMSFGMANALSKSAKRENEKRKRS